MRQIEQRGTALLRIADVAADLDISPALIVYHFQTKDQLIADTFTSAAQHDLDKLSQLTAGIDSARERLRVALSWYAPTGRAKGWRLWIEGWAEGLRQPALQKVGSEFDLAWRAALISIVDDGVSAGEFITDDPRGAAWRITALLDGLAVQVIVHDGLITRAELLEWTTDAVAHELGLTAAAAPEPT